MTPGPVDHRGWAARVLGWDLVVPALIAAVPALVELGLPGRRGPQEVLGVALPIAAFFLRLRAGRRQIDGNRCGPTTRRWQFAVFCVGVLPLIVVDCLLILVGTMPNARMFTREDLAAWVVMLSIYLTSMTFAMYPGRRPPGDDA